MKTRYLHLLPVCALLTSLNLYAAEWQVLTGADLEAAFSEKTIFGKKYVVYYDGSGSMRGKWGGENFTGQYYFKNEAHYCSKWDQPASGGEEEGCWTVEKKKKKLRLTPVSGRATKTQTIKTKDGNIKNL